MNTLSQFSTADSDRADANPLQDGLKIERNLYAAPTDRVTDSGIPDHCISLHLANPGNLERQLDRRLDDEKLISRPTFPGTLTFVPAFRESEWFWQSEVEILDLYLPENQLKRVAFEGANHYPKKIELLDRIAIIDPLLEQLILTAYTQIKQGKANNRIYLESLQNLIAAHLLHHHCTVKIIDTSVSEGLSHSNLKTILDYIHNNLANDMGLAELAEVIYLSSHHFGKLFKQSMGISPHQYVLQCRIEQAKLLLANQQRSLTEIGQAVGFCDQSHFTNTFRRYTGITPRQYRQQL